MTAPDPPSEPHRNRVPWLAALLPVPVALVLAVPAVTVLYRFLEVRRTASVPGALVLYVLYYAARATALGDWVARRVRGG